jgi:N-methylhydantoinase B/oxoprolinase/acetone carboxylase alpha subunit
VRKIEFLELMTANMLSGYRSIPPFGWASGADGQVGRNAVERVDGSIEELGSTATVLMQPGDIFIIETPSGGGFEVI